MENNKKEINKLMERMYRLFSIRIRSEKEVRDYFRIKNYELRIKGKEENSSYVVDTIVEVLKKKGLLNDKEFAKEWVQSRSRKYGINRIKQELILKGIDRETIEEVISHQSSVISEKEIAEKYLEKKMKVWKNMPEMEMRKKAMDYLLRRGFEYSIVKLTVLGTLEK